MLNADRKLRHFKANSPTSVAAHFTSPFSPFTFHFSLLIFHFSLLTFHFPSPSKKRAATFMTALSLYTIHYRFISLAVLLKVPQQPLLTARLRLWQYSLPNFLPAHPVRPHPTPGSGWYFLQTSHGMAFEQ